MAKKSKRERILSAEEIKAKAESEGVELTEEQLEHIAGGWVDPGLCYIYCEQCGAEVLCYEDEDWVFCTSCGFKHGPFEIGY